VRVGFVTCVELGRACINAILGAGGDFEILMTLEDSLAREKSGRVYLDDLAAQYDIKLAKVKSINDPTAIRQLESENLDWLFIVGWSQIAGSRVLDVARLGALGMHPTLLPHGRGRASIPWTILKGLDRSGVTLFKLDSGVDTGPVIAQVEISIDASETATSLYAKSTDAHVRLIRDVWPALADEFVTPRIQDEALATVWPGRTPADGEIFPRTMRTEEIDRLVRATTHPYPGAFLSMPDGTITRIWAGTMDPPSSGRVVFELKSNDGIYYATEYAVETVMNLGRSPTGRPGPTMDVMPGLVTRDGSYAC
jgi:methionyl-tRNA formyltransferase